MIAASRRAHHDDHDLDEQRSTESVEDQRDYLTQLDAAIGDGDHGVNMDRGFDAVGKALAAQDGSLAARQAPDRGGQDARVSTVGGASGPLWGTALRRAGRALGDKQELDGQELVAALARGTRRSGRARCRTSRATRPWSTPSALQSRPWLAHSTRVSRSRSRSPLPRGRGGGAKADGAAAGAQGSRVVPRGALDRTPGSGRHLGRADHGRASSGRSSRTADERAGSERRPRVARARDRARAGALPSLGGPRA